MTKDETTKLLMEIEISYPRAYSNLSDKAADLTENLWYASFGDVPLVIMEMALNRHRMISIYPPTIAEMVDALKHLNNQANEVASVHRNLGNSDQVKQCMMVASYTARYTDTKNLGGLDLRLLSGQVEFQTGLIEEPNQREGAFLEV
jgi:hypothetical protein